MSIFLILFVVFVIFCLIKLSIRPTNFPPGPRGLPVIGYGPLLPKNIPAHTALQNMAKTYGPVVGFFLGPTQPCISVIGPKAIREAMQNDDLNGRPSSALLHERTYGEKLGVIFVDGPFWQEQRRFTLRHLRDLGFGKTSIEDQMMDEVLDLIRDMKETSASDPQRAIYFDSYFNVSVINILWAIIGGKRFNRGDRDFVKLLGFIEEFVSQGNVVSAVAPVPAFLIRLFPKLPKLLGLDSTMFVHIQQFIEEALQEHLSTRSKGDAARDFMDVYLEEMEQQQLKSQSTTFHKKQLVGIILDLFTAGAETSSSTIGFAILYLVCHQEVQRKMQAELDDVCGDCLPTLAHRANLPYCEAVIAEVMRMDTTAPLGVPHCALKETKLQGFTIPKGSVVLMNIDSVSKDPTIWKDPGSFQPERHLDKDGKFVKNEALTPFGIGKRICLGEPLARNTVFLFVTALVKTFKLKPLPNEPLPDLEPRAGLTLAPKPFKATIVQRS